MLAVFERIYRFINTHKLLGPGARVMVAYSAGPDSTLAALALKDIAEVHRTRWTVELAHFHHGIDADDDLALDIGKRFAAKQGFALHVREGKLGSRTRGPGTSLQMLARKMRYRFLLDLAREHDITTIVTAHQLDDQAETVLMRAIGGSWLTALSAIPVRRPLARGAQEVEVVRPLLESSRAEIMAALEELNVEYHLDAENKNVSHRRNAVRHQLMPLILKRFNPAVGRHLSALAQQATELDVDLTARARRLVPDQEFSDVRSWIDIPLSTLSFEARLQQRYIVREALLQLGIPARHVTFRRVESALQLAGDERRGVTVQLTADTRVSVNGNHLRLERMLRDADRPPFLTVDVHPANGGGFYAEPHGSLYRSIAIDHVSGGAAELDALLANKPPDTEYADAGKVEFPLVVRARRDGDRFAPLGMKNTRKLQDYLTDLKVEQAVRDRVPLLCDAKGIVWVVGHGISERVRVTSGTRQMLRLSARVAGEENFPPLFEIDSGE
ncbi:MAG: tRNA lysidine(34) synthetase TilS [Planctomycetaceae bacterium]|nr:tRNA lysidine(34) synthetase TilS [Planctomycetaceae bacterium]